MPPLIVLTAQDERVLHPGETLPDLPADRTSGPAEIVTFGIGVPDVERPARAKGRITRLVDVDEELQEVRIAHRVVHDLASGSVIVHVVRRIREQQVGLHARHQALDVRH